MKFVSEQVHLNKDSGNRPSRKDASQTKSINSKFLNISLFIVYIISFN
jgi:hypothetical protein